MSVKFRMLEGGYCTHKEKMVIKGGKNEEAKFHSMFALIIHPEKGAILYDTGYTKRYYAETASFPYSIYAKLTPVYVKDEDTAIAKLQRLDIAPEDIKYIIISHFHADHVAALRDFPQAQFIYMKEGYDKVKGLKGFRAVKQGYLSGLMPDDFENRSIALDSSKNDYKVAPVAPFSLCFDYFGDGSIKFIPLSGHYRGHLGALIKTEKEEFFLIADSCWLSKSYRENIGPHVMANLIMDNPSEYKDTLTKIHNFHKQNPQVNIIPSHCEEVFAKYVVNQNEF